MVRFVQMNQQIFRLIQPLLYGLIALILFTFSNTAAAHSHILLFEDPTGRYSDTEMLNTPHLFQPITEGSRGFSNSTFWLRVELSNASSEPVENVVQFSSLLLPEVVEIYSADGERSTRRNGYRVPINTRPIKGEQIAFPVLLPALSTQVRLYKIRSDYKVDLDYKILSPSEADALNEQSKIATGAIIGALAVLLAYNLVLLIILQSKVYLAYCLFLGMGLIAALLRTRAYEWFFDLIDPIAYEARVGQLIYLSALYLLSQLFKQYESQNLRRAIFFGYIFIAGHSFLEPYALMHFYSYVSGPIIFATLSLVILNALVKGDSLARFVMLGWSGYIILTLFFVANLSGRLGPEFERFVLYGHIFEGLIFSAALAHRLKAMDRTTELLKRVEQMLADKETLLTRQKEIFAIIGHELRTPVSTISMLVSDNSLTSEDKEQQIQKVSDDLLQILEDLRVVVAPERALESRGSDASPIECVRRALVPLETLVRSNNIKLSVQLNDSDQSLYHFHAQALRQSVINLVKNAALHSTGSTIWVRYEQRAIGLEECEGQLCVEDDGVGIPEQLRDHVFEAFGRGESSSDGSGLGLHIVKELAARMNGTLDYSTSHQGGACFTLRFPMKRTKLTEPSSESSALTLSGMRIMLAEDDRTLRLLTQRILEGQGASVDCFENGRLAVEAFDKTQYDLVITDLMMPEIDGHCLTRNLRASGATIPIVAVTAAIIGTETSQFLAEGATGVIHKPLTPAALINVLDQAEKSTA